MVQHSFRRRGTKRHGRFAGGNGSGRSQFLPFLTCFLMTVLVASVYGVISIYAVESDEGNGSLNGQSAGGLETEPIARRNTETFQTDTVPVSFLKLRPGSRTNILDVQIQMCTLDREAYFQQPYVYPMFKDLVKRSRCDSVKGRARTVTTIRELKEQIQSNPKGYLEPSGFVFHMSRCGSTLTANLLGASPNHLVYSESRPPAEVFSRCDALGCTEEEKMDALRTVVRAMGKSGDHQHLFFKFQSSMVKYMPDILKAFPDTPWIFVYRDPVPVLMSLLGFRGGQLRPVSSNTPCLRSRTNPPESVLKILGVSRADAARVPVEDYCAAHLEVLCSTALNEYRRDSSRGLMVNYQSLPESIVPVLRDHFKTPISKIDEDKALKTSTWYAKSKKTETEFEPDTKVKEENASSAIKRAAEKYLGGSLAKLLVHSVPAESIPEALGAGGKGKKETWSGQLRDLNSGQGGEQGEDLASIPEHLRGLNRVVDPLAPEYMTSKRFSYPMEEFKCPDVPPIDYPKGYPVMDVVKNWNPDDASYVPPNMYLSTCRFDYQEELEKATRYHHAEKPFILYNIPSLDAAVGRWSDPAYMDKILGGRRKYRTEHSTNNHFMYYNAKPGKKIKAKNSVGNVTDWEAPTDHVNLSYMEWLEMAKKYGEGGANGPSNGEHWYFRVGDRDNKVIKEELEIFQQPDKNNRSKGNIFLKDPGAQRGIHCRFGMAGVIAEAHFDGSRNMVALLSGARRWIMAHPNQCSSMYLLPMNHPSGRHSEVDWSNPDLSKFPNFPKTQVSEILLRAGEVLYVPTDWFHYISNIGINAQCNSRSGISGKYKPDLQVCGFGFKKKKQGKGHV